MELLNVYQIYYKPEQEHLLEYTPYFNPDCTVYFENQVISDLVLSKKHCESQYFGVVSYKLREKIGSVMKDRWASMPNIANHSLKEFTPELFHVELEKQKPDVMSFQRHLPHDPISVAGRFHPGFAKYFTQIMQAIGYDYKPIHFEDVFYCNFFVARSEIYNDFVLSMLQPAMLAMDKMPELMENSRYPHPLPNHLANKWGINHYPYHAFLCERMFSYYVHLNKLKCLHY